MRIGIATCAEYPNLLADEICVVDLLKERGHDVVIFIWNQYEDLEHSTKLDAVVIRTTWDYHKHFDKFMAWLHHLHQNGTILVNSIEIIMFNIDKHYLLELRDKYNVPIVPSESCDVKSSSFPYDKGVVIKPFISANSYRTIVCKSVDDEVKALNEWQANPSDYIRQPFMDAYIHDGEYSVFFDLCSRTFSHAVKKTPKEGDFRTQPGYGSKTVKLIESDVPQSVLELCVKCCDAMESQCANVWHLPLQAIAYMRVDCVLQDGAAALSELEMIEPYLYFVYCRSSDSDLTLQNHYVDNVIKAIESYKLH